MRRCRLLLPVPSGQCAPHAREFARLPAQPTPPRPLAPFSSFLAFSLVWFFLSGLLGGHPGSFRQCTPCPPPAPLAPFSSFLAFSFVLFLLSGLLGGHPGSFSQRIPSPHPCPQKKRARRIHSFLCISVPVSKEHALNNSPLVE